MKKFFKHSLAILLALVMVIGVAPLSDFAGIKLQNFNDLFSIEASAASISSTVTAPFVIFLPSGVKMYSCSSATGATNSTPYFSGEKTIYATEKIVLSNGNVRFLITANTASGERTLYYQLPSSATAYQLPNQVLSITNNIIACRDKQSTISWTADPYASFYNIVVTAEGKTLYSGNVYKNSSGIVEVSFSASQLLEYGVCALGNATTEIKGYRTINGSNYNYWINTFKPSWNSCQNVYMGSTPYYWHHGIEFDANGGYGGPTTQDWSNPCSGYTTLTSSVPSRDGYTFLGWATSSTATQPTYYPGSSVYFNHDRLYLYAVWSKTPTYMVSYNANGGLGAPSSQTKTKDITLWLSSTKPTKSYTVTYNANGGSVSPSSKTVSCTFKNWNTSQNGSGTSYSSGSSYTSNSGATLYAQWSNPTFGTLPTPTMTGYTFDGWYTSASGGTKITSSDKVSSNTTLYAHWSKVANEDIYNLGEESYSFSNFGDNDSPGGHCFGMSVTSSAYYIRELDIATVGGNYEQDVYSLKKTSTVSLPICYYQDIQDSRRDKSMVAGGSSYKNGVSNIASDWTEVVNYVKNHNYDNKGTLQIGFRKNGEGGHAINFLYYAEVNGQPRIYAYDNNYPDVETYFYMDSNGKVLQAPRSTFSGAIDCITLRSVPTYFDLLEGFDSTRYIYANKDAISIEGTTAYLLEGDLEMGERVMFEVPAGVSQVTITPLVDNAEFEYLDESYSFGEIDDDTIGTFTLSSTDDEGAHSPSFIIENEPESKGILAMIIDFFKMIIDFLLLPFTLLL